MRFVALFLIVAVAFALDNGLALLPPMGWMNWEQFMCQTDCVKYPKHCVNEDLFVDMINRMYEDGWKDLGYEYVNIDDCWMTHDRDAQGKIYADKTRFPHGLKWLTDYAHSKGLKIGIYNDYGTKTCAGYTGSKGNLLLDAQTFADWGFDMLKMDGCNSETIDQNDGYPAMAFFLNSTGRPILFSCSWPAYDLDMDYAKLPPSCNMWRNWWDIQSNWKSVSRIIDKFGNETRWAQYAGPGHWNDADQIVIGLKGGTLTVDESKTHFALWAILASPFIMSNDLRELDEHSRKILMNKEIIDVNQDKLGKQGGRLTPYSESRQIWVRELAGGEYAVALFNQGPVAQNVKVYFHIFTTIEKLFVRDLYLHKDLGVFANSLEAVSIPAHGVRMFRMRKA